MSYLAKCEFVKDAKGGEYTFRIKWRSVQGVILVDPHAKNGFIHKINIYYKRYSRLGHILTNNAEQERVYIKKALLDDMRLLAHTADCYVAFTGVH